MISILLSDHLLSLVIMLPVAAGAIVFWRSDWQPAATRRFALAASLLTLALAALATARFIEQSTGHDDAGGLHLVERLDWLAETSSAAPLRLAFHVALDGISLPLLLLTAFLTPLVIAGSFSAIRQREREFYALLLLLHGSMLGVFCARDLLLFYIFFEFTLIPLYFLIAIWGGPQRQKAANMFFIYTLSGSMLTFAGVLYLGWKASLLPLGPDAVREFSFSFDRLYALAAEGHLSAQAQTWLFLAFFAGFAIKVPLFPFHTWLPLAHTEAPTAGSVLLASVLLKLGTYGFLRLSLPMLPDASAAWGPLLGGLAVAGIIYGALAAWVQSDIKKLVAYSSVSHLGFCLLGMFSFKMAGLTGSLLYMVNHGLSTGALFLVVGMVYERYHTREIDQIGGLARRMPVLAFFLVFFTMSSIGLPGLNGFVSEFLVLLGAFTSASTVGGPAGPLGLWFAVIAATGLLLGAIYMLHMARCVLFGPLKEPHHGPDHSAGLTPDLTGREVGVLAPIALACLLLGIYPKPATELMMPAIQTQVLARLAPSDATASEPGVAISDLAAPKSARLSAGSHDGKDLWHRRLAGACAGSWAFVPACLEDRGELRR